MKRFLLLVVACVLLASCAKQDISDILTDDQDLSQLEPDPIPAIYSHTAPIEHSFTLGADLPNFEGA